MESHYHGRVAGYILQQRGIDASMKGQMGEFEMPWGDGTRPFTWTTKSCLMDTSERQYLSEQAVSLFASQCQSASETLNSPRSLSAGLRGSEELAFVGSKQDAHL